jgi:hypothetical protein
MLMKYKDFKMLSKDDMKQILGGDAPAGSFTFCGTCTNMNGTTLERSNVVCGNFPNGSTCTNMEGHFNDASACSTPGGGTIETKCPNLE